MQVVFLGGASSVGASCLAIQLAGQWIVVDAGVRVDRKSDPLPDLALLEGKDVRAIFVTHAHADHIGALPLVHQAFPTVPIFASRATGLLMEVMLSDALKIMNRRAMDELELPLYPEALVSGMLNRVRPLPLGEKLAFSELPGITVHASRAGHIAGAVSLGFTAADGSVVISGDVSITPQCTVLGALPPPLTEPDLLVLESTYGTRLHPNRQAEELRLAEAVAEGIARGGHTLIPCFALGRGQEILLLLQAAQEKGQIPDFPIYVDGLVRRVCSTYMLLPEALSPVLQRQIRKGYLPFNGSNVTFVRDERERERLLAGPPAGIISSSGMLTGGPSAWYAARLAPQSDASILITGYQDEESPGKRLLDLAEQKKNTLDIGGQQVQVLCHVAKYNLSAHADGGELAAYATALRPKRVALVHGDEEARAALRTRLVGLDVLLPTEGMAIEKEGKRRSKSAPGEREGKAGALEGIPGDREGLPVPQTGFHNISGKPGSVLDALPVGIGGGVPFDSTHVEQVWRVISPLPTWRIVTARELALVWYGEATEEKTRRVLDIFAGDYEQRYFVRQNALEEAFRVRGQSVEAAGDFLTDLVGNIVLLAVGSGSTKPVLCRAIEPGAAVRVQFPRGISYERTRFPLSAILDLIGPPQQADRLEDGQAPSISVYLADLVRNARRIRRTLSAYTLAWQCQEEATYTLGDMCTLAGVSAQSLEERLAVAKLLHKHPALFMQSRTFLEGEGLVLYSLAPSWREALEEPEERPRPDQNWILNVLEQHLGTPPDLYRRSIDPDTGTVTLSFHFPDMAQVRYAAAIAAAEEETGVSISIAPNAHQGMLTNLARRLLPEGLTQRGTASIHLEQQIVQVNCLGDATQESIQQAQEDFYEQTGWHLQLDLANSPVAPPNSIMEAPRNIFSRPRMDQNQASSVVRSLLTGTSGLYKIGVDASSATLWLRFYFPDVVQAKFAEQIAEIEAQTGWNVRINPAVHQEALVAAARRLLPVGLTITGAPSLYHDRHALGLTCTGSTNAEAMLKAQEQFLEETGWQLELVMPAAEDASAGSWLPQGEAIALASSIFSSAHDLYRIGADAPRRTIWLYFHFPYVARQRYAEQLAALSAQSGWRVDLHRNVHQKALIETACRLLPGGLSFTGKASLHLDRYTLNLTCTGQASREEIIDTRRRFNEETGWHLEILNFDNQHMD